MKALHLQKAASFEAEPHRIWRILADADRLNREIGLPVGIHALSIEGFW
ncbi:MAG: hypothetical protein Q9P14_18335 [candidate division KSB1 bacterium]|nr:hypothetical protein [candidate division KSB1 bacterium]MDQ7066178.1 hypothetical protein [candidate division KSB1 bacterium]